MDAFAEFIAFIAAIGGIYQLYRIHREAKREHPALDYATQSTPVADSWRWREPPHDLGLTLENDQVASRIVLPFHHTGVEIFTSLFGYALLGLLLYLMLISLWTQPGIALVIFMVLLLAPLSWVLLNVDSHMRAIELRREDIRFAMQYGIFLQRHIVFRRHPQLSFAGGYQSMFEMNQGQDMPDFKLMVKKSYWRLFSKQQKFYLLCNQSQGSWIVGGLNAWNQTLE